MIIQELKTELKTSVPRSMLMSPWSSDMKVDNMKEGIASTRRKLSENFIQLAVHY